MTQKIDANLKIVASEALNKSVAQELDILDDNRSIEELLENNQANMPLSSG